MFRRFINQNQYAYTRSAKEIQKEPFLSLNMIIFVKQGKQERTLHFKASIEYVILSDQPFSLTNC